MDHIQGQDRNQIVMTSLDQWGLRESFARIIDAFVDALDLSGFGFKYFGEVFKTIANFRKDNAQAFRKVFRHFVAIMKDWKLVDHLTVDRLKSFTFLELIIR